MRRSRWTTRGLLARHLLEGWGTSVLLGLLVAAAVFAIAITPRSVAQVSTAELHHELGGLSPLLLDLSGSGRIGIPLNSSSSQLRAIVSTTDGAIAAIRDRIPAPLSHAVGEQDWVARTNAADAVPPQPAVDPSLSLALDLEWQERIEIVDGSAPRAWTGMHGTAPPGTGPPPIEVAISGASAEAIGVGVGDELDYAPARLLIAAVYEPLDRADPYWAHASDLAVPTAEPFPGRLTEVRAGVYVAPESVAGLEAEFGNGSLSAWIPIDPAAITHRDAAEVQALVREFVTQRSPLPFGGELSFRSGLTEALERVIDRTAALTALLALSLSGLAGVLAAVLALGVRAVIARRASAISLAASRGAGAPDVRAAMLLGGLVISLPPAIVATVGAAIVLPADLGPAVWLLPPLVALLPPALLAASVSTRPVARRRSDPGSPGGSRARTIAELAVLGLAVVALVLLSRRGLVPPSADVGVDPLLSATPLLLAAAGCLGALRLFPLAVRGVQRAFRHRGGAATVVGAARAIREPVLGFATALALVVGVSIVVFSTVMSGTVRAGLVGAAVDQVGADARVQAPAIDASALEHVRAVDGVREAVTLSSTPGVPLLDGADELEALVVVADTAALHAVRPDIPVLGAADGRVPVMLSSDWSDGVMGAEPVLGAASVRVVGSLDERLLPGLVRRWVLVDASAAPALGVDLAAASTLLLRADAAADLPGVTAIVADAVRAAQPASLRGVVTAIDAVSLLDDARTPAIRGLDAALLAAAAASLALVVVTIALATVSASAARNRLIGVLRVIGMSNAQLRRVLAWELGPLAVTAIAVGTALGLALPVLVASVLDLRPFLGGRSVPAAVIEPIPLLLALGVFCVVVLLSALSALALGRRLAPAGILKMGDS